MLFSASYAAAVVPKPHIHFDRLPQGIPCINVKKKHPSESSSGAQAPNFAWIFAGMAPSKLPSQPIAFAVHQ